MSAQEDYDFFSKVAEKLGLDEDEGGNFINSAMKRLGHVPRAIWEDAPDSKDDSGDFFSSKRQARETREVPRKRASGESKPWGYQ